MEVTEGIGDWTSLPRSANPQTPWLSEFHKVQARSVQTRAYTLSSRLLEFSHTVLVMDRLREKAHPYLHALNRRTGETVNLMKLEDNEIVYINRTPFIRKAAL